MTKKKKKKHHQFHCSCDRFCEWVLVCLGSWASAGRSSWIWYGIYLATEGEGFLTRTLLSTLPPFPCFLSPQAFRLVCNGIFFFFFFAAAFLRSGASCWERHHLHLGFSLSFSFQESFLKNAFFFPSISSPGAVPLERSKSPRGSPRSSSPYERRPHPSDFPRRLLKALGAGRTSLRNVLKEKSLPIILSRFFPQCQASRCRFRFSAPFQNPYAPFAIHVISSGYASFFLPPCSGRFSHDFAAGVSRRTARLRQPKHPAICGDTSTSPFPSLSSGVYTKMLGRSPSATAT